MAAPAVLSPAQTRFRHELLRAAREASDLSLRDVAAVTGWHHSTVHRYEQGDVSPTAETIVVLTALYRMSPGDLFTTATT